MNRKIAFTLVLASIAAGSAFAETPMAGNGPVFKSTLTREQVQAELQQYRQAGIDPFADGYNQLTAFRSTRTRADVRAEFLAERDMVSALNGEDSGSRYFARRELPRTVGRQLASVPAGNE